MVSARDASFRAAAPQYSVWHTAGVAVTTDDDFLASNEEEAYMAFVGESPTPPRLLLCSVPRAAAAQMAYGGTARTSFIIVALVKPFSHAALNFCHKCRGRTGLEQLAQGEIWCQPRRSEKGV